MVTLPIESIIIYAILTTISIIDRLMILSGGYSKIKHVLGIKKKVLEDSLKSIKEVSLLRIPEYDNDESDELQVINNELHNIFEHITFDFEKNNK